MTHFSCSALNNDPYNFSHILESFIVSDKFLCILSKAAFTAVATAHLTRSSSRSSKSSNPGTGRKGGFTVYAKARKCVVHIKFAYIYSTLLMSKSNI